MKAYLNVKELSEYLGIKKSTLYAKVSGHQIPHYKIDRLVRFKKTEIDDWMETMEKRPLDLDKIIKKSVEESGSRRYKHRHRETGPESQKGGRYGTF